MTDREAVDFLKKARLHWCVPRKNGKQITMELYIEAMTKAINALEEKTKALPIPMSRPHGEWEHWGSPFTDDTIANSIVCSLCKARYVEIEGEAFNFCPNCGADMREGEAE